MRCIRSLALIVMASFFVAVSAGAADHYPTLTPVKRVTPHYPKDAQILGSSACMQFSFAVTPEGKVTDIRLAKSYPAASKLEHLGFVDSTRTALSQWTFIPPVRNDKPVSVPHVFQTLVYLLSYSPPDSRKLKTLHETISWLCDGGLTFVTEPIRIAAAQTANAPAAESSAWSDSDTSPHTVQYTLLLDAAQSKKIAVVGKSDMKTRYCIDTKGRLSNVVLTGGDTDAQAAALAVLNTLDFKARTIEKSPVWTCGLHTRVQFYEHARGRFLGTIAPSWFNTLAGHPTTPKFLSSTPPEQQISVPKGAKLPSQANIEVRFCISSDGKPYGLRVMHADPPGIFDRAALETVAGWHFASSRYAVCDIYQDVSFKIPHVGG